MLKMDEEDDDQKINQMPSWKISSPRCPSCALGAWDATESRAFEQANGQRFDEVVRRAGEENRLSLYAASTGV